MTDDVIKGQEGRKQLTPLSLVYRTETRNRLIDEATAGKVEQYAEVHICVVFATVGAAQYRRGQYWRSITALLLKLRPWSVFLPFTRPCG